MIVPSRRAFALSFVVSVAALSACSGGASIPAQHPGETPNPTATVTPTPSGATATPTASGATPTPTPPGATPTPTPTPTPTGATPTPTGATPTPTATPKSTPTPTPSAATPTPSATPTTAACPPSYPPSPTATTVPVPPNGGTLTLPGFGDFSGTATTSALTSGSGSQVTIDVSNQNFDNVSYASNQAGTPIVFTSLSVSQSVKFANASIATVVTSPCSILPGHTYTAELYVAGTYAGSTYGQADIVPNGDTISFSLGIPLGGDFPASVTADVVITQN